VGIVPSAAGGRLPWKSRSGSDSYGIASADEAELLSAFVAAGGEIWGCSACTTPRGTTEDDLVDGARIVGAAATVAAVAEGATPVALG
jgi:hypothetical protein